MAGQQRGSIDPETEQASKVQQPVLVRRFRLVVKEGIDQGKIHLSEGKRVVIGTHESAEMLLRDRAVSRFHCEVSISEGYAVVKDLGSRDGTWVNGVPVHEAPLLRDSVIAIGRTKLLFDIGRKKVEIPASLHDRFGGLVGKSPAMRAVYALLERAAGSDLTVLLEGQTGTGKGLAAEAIHNESARRDGPFVVVDCSAMPPNLSASEIFGHVRGAFTGAVQPRTGALQAAHGGTLFLDEIGELDPQLQPQLLRAIDRREVKPIGARAYTAIDVRIIAATHRDLRAAVNAGLFRSDLFFRLAVDDAGGVYLAATIFGPTTIGSTTLTPKGDPEALVAKMKNDGSLVWVVPVSGAEVRASGIAVAPQGESLTALHAPNAVTVRDQTYAAPRRERRGLPLLLLDKRQCYACFVSCCRMGIR